MHILVKDWVIGRFSILRMIINRVLWYGDMELVNFKNLRKGLGLLWLY